MGPKTVYLANVSYQLPTVPVVFRRRHCDADFRPRLHTLTCFTSISLSCSKCHRCRRSIKWRTSQAAMFWFLLRIRIRLPFNIFLYENKQQQFGCFDSEFNSVQSNTRAHCMVSHWMLSEATKWPDGTFTLTHTIVCGMHNAYTNILVYISFHSSGPSDSDEMTHHTMMHIWTNDTSGSWCPRSRNTVQMSTTS